MSNQQSNELGSILMGALTATTVGSFIFEAIGAFILGILGAAGAYLFSHIIVPAIKNRINKKKQEKAG